MSKLADPRSERDIPVQPERSEKAVELCVPGTLSVSHPESFMTRYRESDARDRPSDAATRGYDLRPGV